MPNKKIHIRLLFRLLGLILMAGLLVPAPHHELPFQKKLYADDMATLPKNVLYVMLHYKQYFGKTLYIAGRKAEQEENEFVLDAFPHEADALKVIDNQQNWLPEDLFLTIRVENQALLKEISKIREGQPIVIRVQVRESAVYDRIVPVFILNHFQLLKTEK